MHKAVIQNLKTFLFHGEPYFEVAFTYLEDPDHLQRCRLGNDALPPHTKAGDIVWVQTLMSTVVGFHKEPPK